MDDIKIIETADYNNDIVSLWCEAFGDTPDDVLFFLNNARNIKCVCLLENMMLRSMLFLVDCKIKDKNGKYKYIYAACTAALCRSKGYMSMLLQYCTDKYVNVLLIPADEKLAEYYKKRNFNHKVSVKDIVFNERHEITEYLFDGCALDEPYALACGKEE